MRKLIVITLALASFLSAGAALADDKPATHRGTGTEIANNYRFFHEDRERMATGAYRGAMEQAQRNIDAYATMRARQGRPVPPRR
jgi:hypothetical protein